MTAFALDRRHAQERDLTAATFPRLGSLVHPIEETSMAKKTVLVSDMSGKEIPAGEGATVTVKFVDARRGTIVMDVTNEEGQEIGKNGRKQARRGRPPKSSS